MTKLKTGEYATTIDLSPFPYELRIIVTDDIMVTEKRIRDSYKDKSPLKADKNTGAMAMHSAGVKAMFILLPFACDVGNVAHEVWHTVRSLLLFVGAGLENEVVAYYLGWLTRESVRFNYEATKAYEKVLKRKLDKAKALLVK